MLVSSKQSTLNVHGVAVKIYDCGVLITGRSGIGKSDLALNLIDKGHKLIADDSILITRDNNELKLNAPKENLGFIYVSGIGFIDISNLYSKKLINKNITLNLIVELSENQKSNAYNFDAKEELQECILGITINKFILPINNNRPLPLLIETLIKNYIQLKQNGYNSHKEFIKNHQSNLL